MTKKFQRTIEDFVCENCGLKVQGTGYTNHCPKCLWSKHVDKNPGDRSEKCGGMMKPVKVFLKKQDWVIEHQCQRCGEVRKIKANEEDNQIIIAEIIKREVKGE